MNLTHIEARVVRLEAEAKALRAAVRDLVAELAVLASRHVDLIEMIKSEGDLAAKVLATVERNQLKHTQLQ